MPQKIAKDLLNKKIEYDDITEEKMNEYMLTNDT